MSGAKKLTDINKNEYASRNLIKKLLKCSIIVWHSDSRNKWYESPYNFLSLSLILVAIEKLIQVKSKFINLSLNPWNDVFWLMLDVLASTPNNFIDNFYRSNEKWGKKSFLSTHKHKFHKCMRSSTRTFRPPNQFHFIVCPRQSVARFRQMSL